MAPVSKPLWFTIRLHDCNRQLLAQWNYDEIWPVTAPQFTYPNESSQAAYFIEFWHHLVWNEALPAHVDINRAISAAVEAFANKVRS
jgi:hypothetical protein